MRDRILAAVITAIVHNKKMSIAGLVAGLGLLAAKLGLEVSPDVLVWLAGLIIVALGAAGGDSHRRVAPLLLLCLALSQAACPKPQTVRSIAAATVVACGEFKAEVAADLTPDEASVIDPLVDEVGAAANGVFVRSADWGRMGAAERRQLAVLAVEQLGGAVERLSARGVGLKSEGARRKLANYLKWGRRAVSALRVIEASLPPPER